MNKEEYIKELKMQLNFVDTTEEWEDIWASIRYLEGEEIVDD